MDGKMSREKVIEEVKKLNELYLSLCSEIFNNTENTAKKNVVIIDNTKYIPLNGFLLDQRATRHHIITNLKRMSNL